MDDGTEYCYEKVSLYFVFKLCCPTKVRKENIVEKRLFPYIPFYIVRYEKEIASEGNIEKVTTELVYFRDELVAGKNRSDLRKGKSVFKAVWQTACIGE